MNHLVTLEKSSPQFESYLRGTFSETERALPVKSLNVNSDGERVTFQVVSVADIKKPSFVTVWLKALRPRTYLTVLFPMLIIYSKNYSDNTILDPVTALIATFGVVFLFAAFTLRNAYADHIKGFDRIDPLLGSRPIQSGWLTAEAVRKAANRFLALSLIAAFAVFIAFPPVLLFIFLVAAVGYGILFRLKRTFKEIAGGELGILLLVGPLLCCGYEMSISGTVRPETLILGFIWGWIALLPIHLRNLAFIVSQSQAGVSNLVNMLGFDGGKKLIHAWWYASLVFFTGYNYFYAGLFWFWFFTLILVFVSLLFSQKLLRLQSPIGSRMSSLQKRAAYFVNYIMMFWVIENLWALLV